MIGLEGGKRPPECPRASLICEEYEQQEDSKNVVQLGGGGHAVLSFVRFSLPCVGEKRSCTEGFHHCLKITWSHVLRMRAHLQ